MVSTVHITSDFLILFELELVFFQLSVFSFIPKPSSVCVHNNIIAWKMGRGRGGASEKCFSK